MSLVQLRYSLYCDNLLVAKKEYLTDVAGAHAIRVEPLSGNPQDDVVIRLHPLTMPPAPEDPYAPAVMDLTGWAFMRVGIILNYGQYYSDTVPVMIKTDSAFSPAGMCRWSVARHSYDARGNPIPHHEWYTLLIDTISDNVRS